MILKLTSRRNIYSAKQLVQYLLSDKGKIKTPFDQYTHLQNINTLDINTLHRDFLDNYKFQWKRKRSLALYHEILSIHRDDGAKVNDAMLKDLVRTYIKMRKAENALVLSRVHFEKHIHIHFMISSNEYRSNKKLRMSKAQMKKLLRDFETFHQEKYPELKNSIVHLNKRERDRTDYQKEDSNRRREKEYQMTRRTGEKPSQKERVFQIVNRLFETSKNEKMLVELIKQEGVIELYSYRGVVKGAILKENGRKFRFVTLGIKPEKIQELNRIQDRLEQLSLIRETYSRGIGRGR